MCHSHTFGAAVVIPYGPEATSMFLIYIEQNCCAVISQPLFWQCTLLSPSFSAVWTEVQREKKRRDICTRQKHSVSLGEKFTKTVAQVWILNHENVLYCISEAYTTKWFGGRWWLVCVRLSSVWIRPTLHSRSLFYSQVLDWFLSETVVSSERSPDSIKYSIILFLLAHCKSQLLENRRKLKPLVVKQNILLLFNLFFKIYMIDLYNYNPAENTFWTWNHHQVLAESTSQIPFCGFFSRTQASRGNPLSAAEL